MNISTMFGIYHQCYRYMNYINNNVINTGTTNYLDPDLTKDKELSGVIGRASAVGRQAADRVHARPHTSDEEEAPLLPGLWLVLCARPAQGLAVVEPLDRGLRRASDIAGEAGGVAPGQHLGGRMELCDAGGLLLHRQN